MTNDKNQMTQSDAKAALNAVQEMEIASMKRSIPPIWLGTILALLVGTLVALAGAEIRTYNWLIIIVMATTIMQHYRKSGVIEKAAPSLKVLIILIIVSITSYFLLVIAAQKLKYALGLDWAPIAVGVFTAAVFFGIVMYIRASTFSKINKKTDEKLKL